MIEDAEALAELDAIVSTPGIDAVLVGRADLAISLGEVAVDTPTVTRAVGQVLETCRRQCVSAFVFVGDTVDLAPLIEQGATGFIVGSDQAFLRKAAIDVRALFVAETGTGS